jgi:hypothetical protein
MILLLVYIQHCILNLGKTPPALLCGLPPAGPIVEPLIVCVDAVGGILDESQFHLFEDWM